MTTVRNPMGQSRQQLAAGGQAEADRANREEVAARNQGQMVVRPGETADKLKLPVIASQVTPTNKDPNFGRRARSELRILKFPDSIENGTPYVLFKIFKTQTGEVTITDDTSATLRGGANVATAILDGIPGGETFGAGVAGAAAGGGVGALLGIGLTTETGKKIANDLANGLFTPVGDKPINITDRAKELVRSFALKRNTQQFERAIALFMPDGITANYNHEYDALSVTAATGGLGFAAQALSAKEGLVNQLNPFISEAASKVASRILGNDEFAKLGLFATTGMVTNPQLETIYTSPKLRQFTFDFRLIPRNAQESYAIYDIISNFKYWSSPDIVTGTGGRFLIPPAQFEIEFYDGNNNTNPYLFKTKKCVLEGISVDYSPNGFATFADGAPVETRLQLNFLETEIIDQNALIGLGEYDILQDILQDL